MNHKNTLQFKDAENITVSAKKLITQLLEDRSVMREGTRGGQL